nr:RNA-directed DNA polymerase, eukaryota, reverse transcriptase zinc-binding domain protein [Tanacetum cinerariifolium]
SKKCGTRNLKVELNSLDSVIDKGDSTDLVVNRKMEEIRLMQEMEKVDNLEVAQKVKIKWAIEGDENSKYYHGVLNKKRSRLTIRDVLADGIWIELPHLVKKEFCIHFKQRFEKPSHQNIRLEMDFMNRLSLDQKDALESEVTNDEVRKAVWDCGVNKTPGPDGFTFGFYRRYWKIIERDVIKAVKWFFLHGSILNGGNASFITLIPKIPNANMVKDFRPISLIGSIYKIIAKILANRLITVLGDLVNEIQSVFAVDRQILDGPFILNDIVQWCKKRNKQAMVFKVDFEKAYDSVRWDFVEDILRKFGFGDKWCTWIRSCLPSSRGSVIVNGSPTKEFQFYKGLKQGDLISRIQSWSETIEGMEARLSRWKLKTLSIGGRLTLIKSVLGAINIYHMSMFKVPMQVLQKLESIMARFFNGTDVNSRKPSWVRWKSVMASKEEVEALKMQGLDLLSLINPKLGNGLNTSFWDVPWRGDIAFKELPLEFMR